MFLSSSLASLQALAFSIMTGEFHLFAKALINTYNGNAQLVNAGINASTATVDQALSPILIVTGIFVNGVLAFFLNYASFTANGVTSPLMMCVAGNMKQALSVVLSIFIFNLEVSLMNAIGILLTIIGGICYTSFELYSKSPGEDKIPLLPTTQKTEGTRSSPSSPKEQ